MGDSMKNFGIHTVLSASAAIELGEALIDAGTDALIYDVPSGVFMWDEKAVSFRMNTDIHPPDDDTMVIVVPD